MFADIFNRRPAPKASTFAPLPRARQHSALFSLAPTMPDGGGARRHGTLSDALRRRAHTLRTRASEPSGIRLVDKLLFCAGVTFIPVTEWVMIVHPYRFSYWYCPARLH